MARPNEVIWQPQPGPQTALLTCPIQEIFYGGARGGGKTEGSIGDWLAHSSEYKRHASGVFFRRTLRQLDEVIARTQDLFPKIGAKYNDQKATWTMPGGARLKFRYLERDRDAQEYQGHNYTRVYIEEVTNFPSPAPINLLRATLRSATGVPTGMRLTGNPGGPGHNWVKARYITPDPKGWKVIEEEFEGFDGEKLTMQRVFIPSRLSDNTLLVKNDPFYVARLRQAGSAALVKAWLEGNWDLVDGAFFDGWDENVHVLWAQDWLSRIPRYALRFRAMDWGYAKPFSVGWYAVSDGTWGLPRGALVKYREWYGCTGQPNVGIRMEAPTVADGILAMERGEQVQYGVADPSIYIRNGGPSIAEGMAERGCVWRRADNQRIPGWSEVRNRLDFKRDSEGAITSPPGLFVLSCCEDTIRTLPTLQHDETKQEDLDTDGEDHAADETRYACMSRPYVLDKPEVEPAIRYPKSITEYTMKELMDGHFAARAQRSLFDEVGG